MSEITGLLGQVVVVRDLDGAVANFQRAGFVLGDRSDRDDWGIGTASFGFDNGSYLELVTPLDPAKEVGGTVAAFLDRRGDGLYLTSFAVDDVHGYHRWLVDRGLPVLGPPQPAPPERGIDCDVMWLRPRASAGAFVQFLGFRGERYRERVTTPGVRRLLTQVLAVEDLDRAVAAFEALGLSVWASYTTDLWGLATAVLRLPDGTNLELVAPTGADLPAAGAVRSFIDRRGPGQYMTVFEVDDVHDAYRRLQAAGVPTLGPPAVAPPESPWGPCGQLWLHPRSTNDAFIELLTMPEGPAPAGAADRAPAGGAADRAPAGGAEGPAPAGGTGGP